MIFCLASKHLLERHEVAFIKRILSDNDGDKNVLSITITVEIIYHCSGWLGSIDICIWSLA